MIGVEWAYSVCCISDVSIMITKPLAIEIKPNNVQSSEITYSGTLIIIR